MGADANSKVFYSRVKGEVEQEINKIGLASVFFFQPSLLLGDRSEFRLGEKVAMFLSPIFGIVMLGSLRKYATSKSKRCSIGDVFNWTTTTYRGLHLPIRSIIALSQQEKPHE